MKPLVALQLRLHQIQIRADDGQRRFQFMSGVGDEPALFFIALRHRADDPPGQDQQKQKDGQQARQGHQDAGEQGRPKVGEAPPAVQKNKADAPVLRHTDVAVVLPKAAGMPGLPYGLRHLSGTLVIHGGDLPGVALEHLPLSIQQNGEEAGFKGGLRGEPIPRGKGAVRLPGLAVRRKSLGKSAPVFTEQLQNVAGVLNDLSIAHGVDPTQDHQKHQDQGQHGGGDEFHPQPLDHARTSSAYPRLRLARISTSACRAASFLRR